jgi:hypothetical protein
MVEVALEGDTGTLIGAWVVCTSLPCFPCTSWDCRREVEAEAPAAFAVKGGETTLNNLPCGPIDFFFLCLSLAILALLRAMLLLLSKLRW